MGNNTQLAINTRIGPREIDPDRIIHFPCGLVGLESEREFALLQIHQDWPLLILQSATTPAVGLMVADPYSFLDSYPIQVGEAETRAAECSRWSKKPQESMPLGTLTQI